MPDRARCYNELRAVMADGMSAYYKAHPDRFGDARSLEAIEASTKYGLAQMLAVLDRYEIRLRTHPETPPEDSLRRRAGE